jgi:hypothetical protein
MTIDWRRFARLLRGERIRGSGSITPAEVVERLRAQYPEVSAWLAAPWVNGARQRMEIDGGQWSAQADDRSLGLRRTRLSRFACGINADVRLIRQASGTAAQAELRLDGRAWGALAFTAVITVLGIAVALAAPAYLVLVIVLVGPLFLLAIARTALADADHVRADLATALGGRVELDRRPPPATSP